MAIIPVSYKWLASMIQLPEGNKIIRVIQEFDDEQQNRCKIIVEGSAMPFVAEGQLMEYILPEVHNERVPLANGVIAYVDHIIYKGESNET